MTTLVGFLGFIVALLALCVSIWAVWSARATSDRENELQERLLALEDARERDRLFHAKRAQVRARIERTSRGHEIVVTNDGPGTARSVKLLFDGAFLEHELALKGQSEASKLGPEVSATYLLTLGFGSPTKVDARITFEDDTGEPGVWESELTV